mgnify:CR=1 FL=1
MVLAINVAARANMVDVDSLCGIVHHKQHSEGSDAQPMISFEFACHRRYVHMAYRPRLELFQFVSNSILLLMIQAC